ncbi:hypothetical protein GCM10027422_48010 [Hymenobacter arcticus]
MISPFLTAPERKGYQQVPAVLSETDLRQHFHLAGADCEFIQRQRRDGNRQGCAVQLGLVRLMARLRPSTKRWPKSTSCTSWGWPTGTRVG